MIEYTHILVLECSLDIGKEICVMIGLRSKVESQIKSTIRIFVLVCLCIVVCLGNVSIIMADSLTADQIKAVQKALNDAGYNCGPVDGLAGKKTQKAVKQYEQDNDLDADGIIDDALMIALGIDPEPKTAAGNKIYKIGELVFEVPEEWEKTDSSDVDMLNFSGVETAKVSFLSGTDGKISLDIIVARNENTLDDLDDLWLKVGAEAVMQCLSDQSYSGNAELNSLSNGNHAAFLEDVWPDSSSNHGHKTDTACQVLCTLVDDYEVFALAVQNHADTVDDEITDELDRILCSFRKDS